jgi:hypothetical protein
MSSEEIQKQIQEIKSLIRDTDDLDEIIEYDEQLNGLYVSLEEEKTKELFNQLRKSTAE